MWNIPPAAPTLSPAPAPAAAAAAPPRHIALALPTPRPLRDGADMSPQAPPGPLREPPACYAPLTPRERQVLVYLSAGQSNKVIAIDLGISMRTAEAHRARILRKMGVRTAQQLGCLTCPYRLGVLPGSADAAPMKTGPAQGAR